MKCQNSPSYTFFNVNISHVSVKHYMMAWGQMMNGKGSIIFLSWRVAVVKPCACTVFLGVSQMCDFIS